MLAYSWAIRLHDYFYGLVTADRISLLISMIASFFLLKRVAVKIGKRTTIVFVALILLPFSVYPLIDQLVLFTQHSWMIVHLFVMTTVLGIRSLFDSKLLFLTPVLFASVFFYPFNFEKAQLRFYDRLESSIETRHGEAQIVQWKKDYWMYYNGQLQFSTIDGHMFREAYVQPVVQFTNESSKVLLIGGDNGIVENELAKYPVELTILPLDLEFHQFARTSDKIRFNAVSKRDVSDGLDPFEFLISHRELYDIIIVDMPDPLNLNYKQYYTLEFYDFIYASLKPKGVMVTQSGDLYKNGIGVQQVWNSVSAAGFVAIPFQCQIPTIGHWSWVMGSKGMTLTEVKQVLSNVKATETVWWNQESADLMFSMGKTYFSSKTSTINTLTETSK